MCVCGGVIFTLGPHISLINSSDENRALLAVVPTDVSLVATGDPPSIPASFLNKGAPPPM